MKKVAIFLVIVFLLSCAGTRVVNLTFTEKFEGLTQLVLASQTTNVQFVETVDKKLFSFTLSDAQIQVSSNVTYDFYVDLEEDGYDAKLNQKEKTLFFDAPPIRVKKPVINQSKVSYMKTGIFINEPAEAVKILESLTDRFIDKGNELLEQDKVQAMCREKLQNHMLGLTKEMGHKVERVVVTFKKEQEQNQL